MLKRTRLIYPLAAVLFSGILTVHAQSSADRADSLKVSLLDKITTWYKNYPQEKVFVQTDRAVYRPGDTCRYKCFAMAYGQPSGLSSIMYVRLSDVSGRIITEQKLSLKDGIAYGNLAIPDSLAGSWYQLQAFTAWMLNFGEQSIYRQNIFLQSYTEAPAAEAKTTEKEEYHVGFYPEGGNVAADELNEIAFKATDQAGRPVSVSGIVYDANRQAVATLKTVHDGMGSFILSAVSGMRYEAEVHFPDGSIQKVNLPAIRKDGISFRIVAQYPDSFRVRIGSFRPREVVFTATQGTGRAMVWVLKLNRGINEMNFPTNNFFTGVVHLKVFDEQAGVIAGRSIFLDKQDNPQLFIIADSLSTAPHARNVLTLGLKNYQKIHDKINMSVSVTDAARVLPVNDNIRSWMLLCAELRQSVYHPSYYFENSSDSLHKLLDLVMLTSDNALKKPEWDTLTGTRPLPLRYMVERQQIIAGQIMNYKKADRYRVKLQLVNGDSTRNFVTAVPDSSGRFYIQGYNRPGDVIIYYELVKRHNRQEEGKLCFIEPAFDSIRFSTGIADHAAKTEALDSINNSAIALATKQSARSMMLKTVDVKARMLSEIEKLIKRHVERFDVDNAYNFDLVHSDLTASSIWEYLQGRIPGLQIIINGDSSGIQFQYRGPSSFYARDMPYFYIDEAPATIDEMTNIQMTDIALIRFIPPPVPFAPLNGGAEGAILVYTKRNGDDEERGQGNIFGKYTYHSFSNVNEADFSPGKNNHSAGDPTVYWAPDLKTDRKGKISIRFHNCLQCHKYRITMEVIDSRGDLGYLSSEF